MNPQSWLDALAAELRRHGVDAESARMVADEAATHLRDSGDDPLRAFGTAESYAAAVAESLRVRPAQPRGGSGPVRLAVEGVTKRYGRRTVLDGVGLTVRAGQIAAVVGANGCGKSTLLKICAGVLSPDAGTVTVHGRLAYCPQDGGTADFLLPDEHYVLIGAGQGLSRRRSRADGRRMASRLGWAQPDGVLARHLSGGTRQKLNLVLSTMTRPDVLLLDEPYQGFDRGAYVNLWEQLWRLRDEGVAIVVVTHLLNQLDLVDVLLDLTGVNA